MRTEYIVFDGHGQSWGEDQKPQFFDNFNEAKHRAEQLAKCDPANEVRIYELVALTQVPMGEPETGRKYPTEHYTRRPLNEGGTGK